MQLKNKRWRKGLSYLPKGSSNHYLPVSRVNLPSQRQLAPDAKFSEWSRFSKGRVPPFCFLLIACCPVSLCKQLLSGPNQPEPSPTVIRWMRDGVSMLLHPPRGTATASLQDGTCTNSWDRLGRRLNPQGAAGRGTLSSPLAQCLGIAPLGPARQELADQLLGEGWECRLAS